MADIELIGVPFDGYGRPANQTRAAAVLRDAGLLDAFDTHRVVASTDLELPPPDPGRGPSTGFINEAALLAMADGLSVRVRHCVAADRFPFIYGGDCTTLLGTFPGLQGHGPPVGLVFIDGHEDTMPLDVSEDGEAANCEIGLLLGLTGRLLTGPLVERLPALGRDQLAMLGQRDLEWRRQFNVGSLRDVGVWLRDCQQVRAEPERHARSAVQYLLGRADRWWLHVDLDVLDPAEFAAQGLPDVDDEPGGLTWDQLTRLLTTAVATGGCIGWSVAIYDPDQDADLSGAHRIIRLVKDVAAAVT